MLAKLWKKVLLAICVIAILFNLTSKIVRRYSLDTQLNSVVGGESLSDIFKSDEEKTKQSTNTTSNSKNTTKSNSSKKTNKNEDEYIDEEENNDSYTDEEEYYSDDDYNNNSDTKKNNNKKNNNSKTDVDVEVEEYDIQDDFESFDEIYNKLMN